MQDPTGRIGRGFYDEIEAKINKWQVHLRHARTVITVC